MQTIKEFINPTHKVYFYLKDQATCRRFFQDAEAEGILFGNQLPTSKEPDDIIALLPTNQICYLGWVGRLAFRTATEKVIRIDYAKLIEGKPYLITV